MLFESQFSGEFRSGFAEYVFPQWLGFRRVDVFVHFLNVALKKGTLHIALEALKTKGCRCGQE